MANVHHVFKITRCVCALLDIFLIVDDEEQPPPVSASEKRMMKREFLRTMQLCFLNGDEKDFNYR